MGNPPDFMHLILPAITLASVSTAYVARIMRSQMLEAMGQDYIRTAMAKGLTERAVVFRHALKNALIPVVTFIGIDLGALMGGAILTETRLLTGPVSVARSTSRSCSVTGRSSWAA